MKVAAPGYRLTPIAMVWTFFYLLWVTLSLVAVGHLLIHKREPSSTLAWLVFVTTIPVLGAILFFILGPLRLERNALKRKTQLHSPLSEGTSPQTPKASVQPSDSTLFDLGKRVSSYEYTDHNNVQILPDPHTALQRMNETIRQARTYVHLEYYIISSDEVTEQLFDSLIAASQRGVEVRVLYDSLGSYSLKKIYFRKLKENGVKISGFLPLSLLPQRLNLNFRNHRKILIVDGQTAFTGGANIGKQYLGRLSEHQWQDYTFEVRGPVCLQLEDVFAKDWQFTTKENLAVGKYYPKAALCGDDAIQVIESGPDTEFRILHQALLHAIHSAKKRVWMTTPYFVPDTAMIAALELASLRGLDVRLILPAKNDAVLVQLASRSFYDWLLQVGIKVFEYQPRILHAKTLIIDDAWTILGSANMDIRSFRLNFELNLLVYSKGLVAQMERLFTSDQAQSAQVMPEEFARRPLYRKILENICRLLSPIL